MSLWFDVQTTLLDMASAAVGFATNWLVQSTLLITIGLAAGRLLSRRGAAAESIVYRTTLLAVLLCPAATWLLTLTPLSGWSIGMPAAWTYERLERPRFGPSLTPGRQQADATWTGPDAPSQQVAALAGEDRDQSARAGRAVVPPRDDFPIAVTAGERSAAIPTGTSQPMVAVSDRSVFTIHWFGVLAICLCLVWIPVTLILSARLINSWRRLARVSRGAEAAEPDVVSLCQELARQLRVKRPWVLRTPLLPSPCLTGLLQPKILLTDHPFSLPVRDVLVHELAHLRRRDCHWNLVRQIVIAGFFFQPLIWILSRRLERTAEEVCDDYVVHFGGDRHEYARQLVDIAELSTLPVAASAVGIVSLRSVVARRVTRILDTSRSLSTRTGRRLLGLILFGGALGTAVVGLVGIQPRTVADTPEASAQKVPAETAEAPLEIVRVFGQVIDSGGNPIAGATVRLPDDVSTQPQTVETNRDGRFELTFDRSKISKPDWNPEPWRQAILYATAEGYGPAWVTGSELASNPRPTLTLRPDDVPIRGQVLTLEGKPVPEATIEIWDIYDPRDGSLDGLLETVRDQPGMFQPYLGREMRYLPGRLLELHVSRGTLAGTNSAGHVLLTADENGTFEIRGIGRERLLRANVTGSHIHSMAIQVITRTEIEPKWQRKGEDQQSRWILESGGALPQLLAATFQHLAGPSFPISGTVRDQVTGKPIAGIRVSAWLRNTKNHANAVTDGEGRYELNGLAAEGTFQQLTVGPPNSAELPYIGLERSHISYSASSPPAPDVTDFDLVRGIVVRGTLFDAQTGEPVKARIEYLAHDSNPLLSKLSAKVSPYTEASTDDDGRFAIAVLPGPGALAVWTHRSRNMPQRYRPANAKDFGLPVSETGAIATANRGLIFPEHYQAATYINLAAGESPKAIALKVQPLSHVVRVRCVRPDGQVARQVSVAGHLPSAAKTMGIPASGIEVGHGSTAYIEIAEMGAQSRRPVVFRHREERLSAILFPSHSDQRPTLADLEQDADGVYRVVLHPGASIVGRLVDAGGSPVQDTGVELHLVTGRGPRRVSIELDQVAVGQDGRFRFENIPAAVHYRLGAGRKLTAGRLLWNDIQLSAGDTLDVGDLNVDAPSADSNETTPASRNESQVAPAKRTITGHVRGHDGQPAAGAHVAVIGQPTTPGRGGEFSRDDVIVDRPERGT